MRQALRGELAHIVRKRESPGHEQLRRHTAIELVENLLCGIFPRIGGIERLARRDVRTCQNEFPGRTLMKERDVNIGRVLQHLVRERRARGDDLDHLAMRQPLCLRIADLFGNRDFEPLGNEARDIAVCCMVGHAAHRALVEVTAAAREGQSELLGSNLCILEEHLVEVPEAKEEQLAGMRLLRAQILLHHRRDVLRVHNEPPRLSDC